MAHVTDLDLTAKDISSLSSTDVIAGFFTKLGWTTHLAASEDSIEVTYDRRHLCPKKQRGACSAF